MATAVYANSEPQSLQALKHHLRKAWTSISPSLVNTTLQNLTSSMPNQLKAVIKIKETPFHTNCGQRRRLTLGLTFLGTLLCYFNSGVV